MKKIKTILFILGSIFIICLCIVKMYGSNPTKHDSQRISEVSKEIDEVSNKETDAITNEIMTNDSIVEKMQVSEEQNTEEPTHESEQFIFQEQTNDIPQVQTEVQSENSIQASIEEQTKDVQQEPTGEQPQTQSEVATQAPTVPSVQIINNCPYTLYKITTRYVENGLAGSQEYIGYYYSNNEQTQDEITVAMQLYKMGYINNMWINVGDYDDHRKVAFAYYWK